MNRRAGKAEKSKSSKVAFYAAKSSKSSQLPIKVTSQTTRVKCPFYGQMKEREFTEVAQEETSFQPAATNAALNVTNTGKKGRCLKLAFVLSSRTTQKRSSEL